MSLQIAKAAILVLLITIPGWSQTPPAQQRTVPIYHVTVVDRTVDAVNYQYRGWATQIDFRGTVLLPKAGGMAIVESKSGGTDIDAKFDHLAEPVRFGPEYLTYVLWAITPEGKAQNLGEVMANGSDKAHIHVTTNLQTFGLIVTAEPYSAVRIPSDVVVAQNEVRPDTIGKTQPIHARFELLPRGTYTYNVPSTDFQAVNAGPKVSMSKYDQTVEIYQAQNAVQIAQSQGAGQYAPEVLAKAEQELANAQQLQASDAGRSAVVTAARQACETAEDARELAMKGKQNAQVAQAEDNAAHERQLREDADARAAQAQEVAEQANAQANADQQALQARQAQAAAAAPPSPPAVVLEVSPDQHDQRRATRAALLQQLKNAAGGEVKVLDSPRGLTIIAPDSCFRNDVPNPAVAAVLARVAPIVAQTHGLSIEVEGYTDVPNANQDALAADRAAQVRDALVGDGLSSATVTARGMGASRPLGPGEPNRRVEIVIAGSVIGNRPLWDRKYPLDSEQQ